MSILVSGAFALEDQRKALTSSCMVTHLRVTHDRALKTRKFLFPERIRNFKKS